MLHPIWRYRSPIQKSDHWPFALCASVTDMDTAGKLARILGPHTPTLGAQIFPVDEKGPANFRSLQGKCAIVRLHSRFCSVNLVSSAGGTC